jgi:predicted nucleic acid-binding protein
MAAVLLDTTVLIDLLRGRPGARQRVIGLRDAGDDAFVCAINVEEVTRGLRDGEEEPAARLFAGLRTAPLGADEGSQAGRWRREFAAAGQTLAQADCLIAAAAMSIGARLATGNPKDFPMSGVEVSHWPVAEQAP